MAYRIAMLVNNDFTRDNRVRREAEALVEEGYEVHLFAVRSRAKNVAKHEVKKGVHIHRILKGLPRYRIWSSRNQQAVFTTLFQYGRFHAIHAHDSNTLSVAEWLGKLHGAPVVYDSHEYWASIFDEERERLDKNPGLSDAHRAKRKADLDKFLAYETAMLPKVAGIISVCDSLCDFLKERVLQENPNYPVDRIVTLRNTFDYCVPFPDKKRLLHEYFHLPSHIKVLLYQGAIAEVRGIDVIMDALIKLNRDDVVLVLMGPIASDYTDHLTERLNHYEVRQKVFYKPTVPHTEMMKWSASADIGLSPILNWNDTRYYCLPNKLFEYIQAGIPLAASNFPEMSKLINAYGIGFTFEPESVDDVAQKIADFLDHSEQLAQYQQNLVRAREEVNWEIEKQKLLNLYSKVLTGKARADVPFIPPQGSKELERSVSQRPADEEKQSTPVPV